MDVFEVKSVLFQDRLFDLPFLYVLRPMTMAERHALLTDIMKNGLFVPIIIDKNDNVIDGINRLRICKEIGMHLFEVKFDVRDLTLQQGYELCRSLNFPRRHLTPEEQAADREQRRERVAELREEGKNHREIAEEVGCGVATVSRDANLVITDPPGSVMTRADRRETVLEHFEDGFTMAEVAEAMGITLGTVRNDRQWLSKHGRLPEHLKGRWREQSLPIPKELENHMEGENAEQRVDTPQVHTVADPQPSLPTNPGSSERQASLPPREMPTSNPEDKEFIALIERSTTAKLRDFIDLAQREIYARELAS